MNELARWDSFCMIVGSAAGALLGLQFVVMTLIASRSSSASEAAGAAFMTPTVVYFASSLFLAALLRAPWASLVAPAVIWGLMGAAGVGYSVVVVWRIYRLAIYRPEFEDWLFHAVLPLAAYAVLTLSAPVSLSHPTEALFGVGGVALSLLFIGIHNAWDTVAFHVFDGPEEMQQGRDEPPGT